MTGAKWLAREWTNRKLKQKLVLNSECSNLLWSSNPRAYEMQLQRRCNNPYFPASQQVVSNRELTKAIIIDYDDSILAEQRLLQLGKEISGLTSVLTEKDFQYFRKSLDEIIMFSIGVGGRTNEIASKANDMRDALISDLRRSFSNHKDLLERLEKIETSFKKTIHIFHNPLMAQMTRERSPIEAKNLAREWMEKKGRQ